MKQRSVRFSQRYIDKSFNEERQRQFGCRNNENQERIQRKLRARPLCLLINPAKAVFF
jgi:hypothetical protein